MLQLPVPIGIVYVKRNSSMYEWAGIGFKWPYGDPLSEWTPFVAFEVILINKLAEITKRYRWRKVKAKNRDSRASMPRKTQ